MGDEEFTRLIKTYRGFLLELCQPEEIRTLADLGGIRMGGSPITIPTQNLHLDIVNIFAKMLPTFVFKGLS
jgi:hypothetical protein